MNVICLSGSEDFRKRWYASQDEVTELAAELGISLKIYDENTLELQ